MVRIHRVEFRMGRRKAARNVARRGMAMPLVAPIWGTGKTLRGLNFTKAFQLSNGSLERVNQEHILLAPGPDGDWMQRSVRTEEAGSC